MSPRAAWRLESLGFTKVYDYVPGEADWFAFGLPMEGAKAGLPRVGKFTHQDVPRCSLSETIGEVRDRVQAAGWNICVVVHAEQVVLGLLREQELELAADPDTIAEQVMRPGPATYRPDALVVDVAERMEKRGVKGVLVTRSDGTLVGWLRREDAARAARENERGHSGSDTPEPPPRCRAARTGAGRKQHARRSWHRSCTVPMRAVLPLSGLPTKADTFK